MKWFWHSRGKDFKILRGLWIFLLCRFIMVLIPFWQKSESVGLAPPEVYFLCPVQCTLINTLQTKLRNFKESLPGITAVENQEGFMRSAGLLTVIKSTKLHLQTRRTYSFPVTYSAPKTCTFISAGSNKFYLKKWPEVTFPFWLLFCLNKS